MPYFKRIIPDSLTPEQQAVFDKQGVVYHVTSTNTWIELPVIYSEVRDYLRDFEDVNPANFEIAEVEDALNELVSAGLMKKTDGIFSKEEVYELIRTAILPFLGSKAR